MHLPFDTTRFFGVIFRHDIDNRVPVFICEKLLRNQLFSAPDSSRHFFRVLFVRGPVLMATYKETNNSSNPRWAKLPRAIFTIYTSGPRSHNFTFSLPFIGLPQSIPNLSFAIRINPLVGQYRCKWKIVGEVRNSTSGLSLLLTLTIHQPFDCVFRICPDLSLNTVWILVLSIAVIILFLM